MHGYCRRVGVPAAVLRFLAATDPAQFPALFDSVAHGALGRASILAAYPRAALWSDREGRTCAQGVTPAAPGFLDALEMWWRRERVEQDAAQSSAALPFAGGWVIFLGYEAATEIEPRLALPQTPLPWRAFALRTPCALIHDLASDTVLAVAEEGAAAQLQALERAAYRAAEQLASAPAPQPAAHIVRMQEEEPELFIERVRRAQHYIRRG